MLCEPGDEKPWRCMKQEDGEWEEVGEFDGVVIEGKKVELPLPSGKVTFDGDNCKAKNEKGMKVLYCNTEKGE